MLRSVLGGTRRESKQARHSTVNTAATDADNDLVIETKERSLNGVIGDMGYSGECCFLAAVHCGYFGRNKAPSLINSDCDVISLNS